MDPAAGLARPLTINLRTFKMLGVYFRCVSVGKVSVVQLLSPASAELFPHAVGLSCNFFLAHSVSRMGMVRSRDPGLVFLLKLGMGDA